MTSKLMWDVFVGPPAPLAGGEARPGQMARTWSPISTTLISGEHDAVLIDALLTADTGCELADWVARGKNLTSVNVRHRYGDHWFGLGSVLDRFPDAKAFPLPAAIEQMRKGSTPEFLASLWNPLFPGQLADNPVLAAPLHHTDTDATTVLHVPELDLAGPDAKRRNDPSPMLLRPDEPCVFEEAS
jgi:hypothetical protein